MKRIEIKAYAKCNLSLFITGTQGGYHLLDMVMRNISLFDRLELEEAGGLALAGDTAGAPGADNLVIRAAMLLREQTGTARGCRIRLTKHIPSMAGLGGGSSDAAAALVGLNRLWELGLSRQELAQLAGRLGADVPFFLMGGCARARGIGEQLTELTELPTMHLVIVKPRAGLSTPAVYRAWDGRGQLRRSSVDAFLWFLRKGDRAQAARLMHNDLEEPAMAMEPQVVRAVEAQQAAGALRAMMTGSGTAVLGWYADGPGAARAASALRAAGWEAQAVTTLDRAMDITCTGE